MIGIIDVPILASDNSTIEDWWLELKLMNLHISPHVGKQAPF